MRALGICCVIAACLLVLGVRAWEAAAQDGAAGAKAPSNATADSPSDTPATRPEASQVAPVAAPNPTDIVANLTIFVLAIFIGFEVITKVPPTLHTPLMSGSNAISGITVVGAIVIAGAGSWGVEPIVGFLAVVLATINVVGGFLVTHRMLSMFKRK